MGSYVAQGMASLGYDVIVFEEHARAGEAICCSGIISRECMERFSLDGNIVFRPASSASFFSPSGEVIKIWKEEIQAYIVCREKLDSLLAERAMRAGALYVWGSHVRDIKRGRDSVRIVAGEGVIESKVVVIATGFGSSLPQRLGLGKIQDFIAGAQLEVELSGYSTIEETEIYLGNDIAPGFFAWLIPTIHGRALAGVISRRKPGAYLRQLIDTLSAQGKIIPLIADSYQPSAISYGGIPLLPLPQTYGERFIVVGDSAGQVKPTTGGGIYYGLLCAQDAVDTLHEAFLEGDFTAHALLPYERRWRKKLGRELRTGYRARRLFEYLDDEQIEQMFQLVKSRNLHITLLESSEFSFDWHGNLLRSGLRHLGAREMVKLIPLSWQLFREMRHQSSSNPKF